MRILRGERVTAIAISGGDWENVGDLQGATDGAF